MLFTVFVLVNFLQTELEKLITENQETEYEIEKLRSELDIFLNGENLSTEVLDCPVSDNQMDSETGASSVRK
ncbi:hypothetical protein FGIG_11197 [Fasciola gigantica]|uniref:Uncharacterized protein n=1 Tax=Fasciola gigantica TaxID=46835 RepID=A0A504WV84_FASGI|nr:hypothetical protein FGIG_11197 [Fasciola gigantica]